MTLGLGLAAPSSAPSGLRDDGWSGFPGLKPEAVFLRAFGAD